jgi:hypothetical protein
MFAANERGGPLLELTSQIVFHDKSGCDNPLELLKFSFVDPRLDLDDHFLNGGLSWSAHVVQEISIRRKFRKTL